MNSFLIFFNVIDVAELKFKQFRIVNLLKTSGLLNKVENILLSGFQKIQHFTGSTVTILVSRQILKSQL